MWEGRKWVLWLHKGKGQSVTCQWGGSRRRLYGSILSSTSALHGVGGQRHSPAALPPGKETRYPLFRNRENIGAPTRLQTQNRAARSDYASWWLRNEGLFGCVRSVMPTVHGDLRKPKETVVTCCKVLSAC